MANVYISAIEVPAIRRDKRIAPMNGNFGSGSASSIIVNNSGGGTISKLIIEFTTEQYPSIADYSLYQTSVGSYPITHLFTKDTDGNYVERSEKPKITIVSGVITSINYDLAIPETGFIILY